MRKQDPNEVFAKEALQEWKKYATTAELEEFEQWSERLSAEDKKERRRELRYRKHIDTQCDITLADRDGSDENYLDAKRLAQLGYTPDLLEYYLATSPACIHELICGEALSAAVKKCTPRQKQALHCYLIPNIKTSDAALLLGTSDRNILKLLAAVRKNIIREIRGTK